jgi:DNA-binding NarL/FixJ family response regulator
MPPTHTLEGLEAAVAMRSRWPGLGVLVLSHYVETQHLMRLIADGGRGVGYLLKDRVSDLHDFRAAVRSVGNGGSVIDPEVITRLVGRSRARDALADLTERERVVLAMMAEGRSNLAISERLVLSPKTVEAHVHSIFGKLELEPAPDDHRRVLAVLTYLRT